MVAIRADGRCAVGRCGQRLVPLPCSCSSDCALPPPGRPEVHLPDGDELAAAAEIARAAADHAYLALSGDKSLLFNASRSAFLMYGIEAASWVSMGDPVGPRGEAAELAWRFCELCDSHAGCPVFYQVAVDELPLYLDLGLSLLKLEKRGVCG